MSLYLQPTEVPGKLSFGTGYKDHISQKDEVRESSLEISFRRYGIKKGD